VLGQQTASTWPTQEGLGTNYWFEAPVTTARLSACCSAGIPHGGAGHTGTSPPDVCAKRPVQSRL